MLELKNYFKYDDAKKASVLKEYYHNHQLSLQAIADEIDKYPNFVRREMKRLGIARRNRSDAQVAALKSGRHEHPTAGQERSENVRLRIGQSAKKRWDNLSEDTKEKISKRAKIQWDNMTSEQKEEFHRAAGDAIRQTAKHGSKLERYLFKKLIEHGYRVEFHKEHVLMNDRLQVDLWLPVLNVAIEVDGPSHIKPIWGEKTLNRNKKADEEKTGLLLGRGMVIIRVRQTHSLSTSYQYELFVKTLEALEAVENKFPPRGRRHIIIGDDNEV